jgi:hypothetical protein
VARQTDELKRANSALQAQIASELSNEQVQATASKLGLIVPEPGAIRYLAAGPGSAALAAKRLKNGDFTIGAAAAPAPAPVVPEEVPAEPVIPEATVPPAETTVADPATVAPTDAAAPVATDPAAGGVPVP